MVPLLGGFSFEVREWQLAAKSDAIVSSSALEEHAKITGAQCS